MLHKLTPPRSHLHFYLTHFFQYKLAAPNKCLIWPPVDQLTRSGINTSCQSRRSSMPYLATPVDQLTIDRVSDKFFFCDARTKKWAKSREIFTGCSDKPYRNRSGVVEFVGRDRLLFARVENDVTKFSPTPPPFWPEILDQKR